MNYPALPGLTMDGQVYYNTEMGTVEAIIPPGPWRTCHGPGMVELPNGDLLVVCAFRYGKGYVLDAKYGGLMLIAQCFKQHGIYLTAMEKCARSSPALSTGSAP